MRTFRGYLRCGAVFGALAAASVVACTNLESTSASDDAVEESAATPDLVLHLATCTQTDALTDPALALPVPDDGHPLPNATTAQILTKVDISAQLKMSGDAPALALYKATVTRGTDHATWTFNTDATSVAKETVDYTQKRAFEAILSPHAGTASPLKLGTDTFAADAVDLWWEAKGSWIVLMKKTDAGDLAVSATAPSCKFDQEAWTLIKHPDCAAALLHDGGAPNGVDCAHVAKETFDKLDHPPADAGADGDADASDGSLPLVDPGPTPIGDPAADSNNNDDSNAPDDAGHPSPKKKAVRQSTCAMTSGGASEFPWLLGIAAVFAISRRRRR